MKGEMLKYMAGLCQAASAALIASAVIVPEARAASMAGAGICAILGLLFIYLKSK